MAALLFVRSPSPGNRISYSDFKAKLEEGKIAEVEIGRERIRAQPADEAARKVSMIPRGMGALGYTMQLPLEDRYVMTRPELLDKITVLMGGRAAEQVVFHESRAAPPTISSAPPTWRAG